jgi:arabinose-5-phosphate isomerase
LKSKHNILQIAINTIDQEINTLQSLRNNIDDRFVHLVELFSLNKGKIVFVGVGKSAIIAQKICGTFNSIGQTSVFLHGADALHGDLGVVQKSDLVLIFSKSGETEEVKLILQFLNRNMVTSVAFTSNEKSTAANTASFHYYLPLVKEADPFNIIPTASTIAQLSIGDALAMCLLDQDEFTTEDLGMLHPQGAIGKKLLTTVKDLMRDFANPFVASDATIKETIISMTSHRLGATVVIDNREIVGIITDGDLRRMLYNNEDFQKLRARDIMSIQPQLIKSTARAIDALQIMEEKAITQLIVLQNDDYVGLIHIHDILSSGIG